MTPNEYQKLALRTEKTPDLLKSNPLPENNTARLLHAVMGLCTEAGEAVDAMKKHLMYGKAIDTTNVLEEVGDVFFYAALALDACGYTFEQAMERNVEKLKARYPDGFTKDKALNRDLDKERKILEGE